VTNPTATNVAQGDAHVDLQAGTVHGDVNFYQLPPDPTPEELFVAAVKYLDARVRDEALDLIEKAVAGGYVTAEVQFHRLIALLSGRTLRQLSTEELDRLAAICASLTRYDDRDEWAAGLKVVIRLLAPVSAADAELILKQVDALDQRQRDCVYGHLEALLEGAIQDEMWQRSVELAEVQRTAGGRPDRVWKFFHPTPAPPRVRPVRPAAVPFRDWFLASAGAALFTFAVVELTVLVAARGRPGSILGVLAGLAGLAAFCIGGSERHYRRARLRAKDAEMRPPQRRWPEAPTGGFASKVDRLFRVYFGRYVPRGTDRSDWLTQTAGIRRQLRDEIVEIYREQRIDAERVAWLVRHLVSDVRQQWERGTLTAYRDQLRVPATTTALCVGGLVVLTIGSLWAVPAAVLAAPLYGMALYLLAVIAAVPAVRASFRIIAERRRVAADEAERADKYRARVEAYRRWQDKLSDKPLDVEMAAWLEADRKVLVDQVMRHYRLRPSQVIAHAFIEAPAASCKRARYPRGPWRYSQYRLLLFLLTDDGVRQVDIDLNFETATSQITQRLNYRFEAVAAVRIRGVIGQRQTFGLTLINGEAISLTVSESDYQAVQHDEDPTKITKLSLDASGLGHTLHVLEGIAAEGKEWVKHQRDRADNRLAKLATTVRRLID
jgi:hypothetical protein